MKSTKGIKNQLLANSKNSSNIPVVLMKVMNVKQRNIKSQYQI